MDDNQKKLKFSTHLNSSHLKNAYFRYENSKSKNSSIFGYNSPNPKKNLLDIKFGTYRGFSNGSIRNNDSLIANSGWPKNDRSDSEKRIYPRRPISSKIRVRFFLIFF